MLTVLISPVIKFSSLRQLKRHKNNSPPPPSQFYLLFYSQFATCDFKFIKFAEIWFRKFRGAKVIYWIITAPILNFYYSCLLD